MNCLVMNRPVIPMRGDRRLQAARARRVKEREERYAEPLPTIEQEVAAFSERVEAHLRKMGVASS